MGYRIGFRTINYYNNPQPSKLAEKANNYISKIKMLEQKLLKILSKYLQKAFILNKEVTEMLQ